MKIYHNPRCSKSREALSIIRSKGVEPEIVDYLKKVPTKAEMKKLLAKLNLQPSAIVRKEEPLFKEKYATKKFEEEEWLQILLENPKLIQRPIVVLNNKAVIGRPPENVLDLF